MATTTPTTAELSAQILGAIEAQMGQSAPMLPKSFIRVLSKVLAAVFITLYKYAGFMSLQMFVATASDQTTVINGETVTPLTWWGRLIGVGDPLTATNAELSVQVNVESQTGSLPSGSQMLGEANGYTYVTVGAVILDAATVTVTVKAVEDPNGTGGGGTGGNLSADDVITFANPLANVQRAAVVLAQTVTGAAAETTDEYRERVVDRFQKRPQGGAYSDYDEWGNTVAGVANIYPYTGEPGQVDVYVESTTETDGIPTTAQMEAVYDAIQYDSNGLASRRPASAWVNVLPISRTAFTVVVANVTADDLATVQGNITAAVEQYFAEAVPFITGLDTLPRFDTISQVEIAGTVNDITRAAGASFTSANFLLDGEGAFLSAYALGEGELAKATVTFA